jgi:hypothetical protein
LRFIERGIVSVKVAGSLLALNSFEKITSPPYPAAQGSGSDMTTPLGPPRRRSLEREIIVAVVVLYLMITGVMVTVHYLQPLGQETATSSRSPSHSERSRPSAAP